MPLSIASFMSQNKMRNISLSQQVIAGDSTHIHVIASKGHFLVVFGPRSSEAPLTYAKCFHFRPTHIFLGLYTSSWKGSVFFFCLENGKFYSYHFIEDSMGSPWKSMSRAHQSGQMSSPPKTRVPGPPKFQNVAEEGKSFIRCILERNLGWWSMISWPEPPCIQRPRCCVLLMHRNLVPLAFKQKVLQVPSARENAVQWSRHALCDLRKWARLFYCLAGGLKYFLFSPLFGGDSQFD